MKKDAHYYAVLAFCRACGFTKESAYEIAYASQYVDDARTNFICLAPKHSLNIKPDKWGQQDAFVNMATCHHYADPHTYNFDSMLNNTCAFHFVPGAEGDTLVHKLRCVQGTDSDVLKGLVEDAKAEGDRIALGIVLHAYADSFTHQKFSGLLSKVNELKTFPAKGPRRRKLIDKIADRENRAVAWLYRLRFAYGHVQALSLPDKPYGKFDYRRDTSADFSRQWEPPEKVDNPDRFRKAFEAIRAILEDYLVAHPGDKDPNPPSVDFDHLFATLTKKRWRRVKAWRNTLTRTGLFGDSDKSMLKYDKYAWIDAAFKRKGPRWWAFGRRTIENAVPKTTDFKPLPWYRFYLAVKWYKKRLYERCAQKGLNLYGLTVPHPEAPSHGSGTDEPRAA